jgi:hypothetical protein
MERRISRQLQRRYLKLLDQSAQPAYIADVQTRRFRWASRSLLDLYGYTIAELRRMRV